MFIDGYVSYSRAKVQLIPTKYLQVIDQKGLLLFPRDLIFEILKNVNLQDILSCMLTCKQFKIIIENDHTLWRVFAKQLGININGESGSRIQFKEQMKNNRLPLGKYQPSLKKKMSRKCFNEILCYPVFPKWNDAWLDGNLSYSAKCSLFSKPFKKAARAIGEKGELLLFFNDRTSFHFDVTPPLLVIKIHCSSEMFLCEYGTFWQEWDSVKLLGKWEKKLNPQMKAFSYRRIIYKDSIDEVIKEAKRSYSSWVAKKKL